MSDLVSVIIPVYNLEGYIGNCLEKMLCQTYKNIEIICVDDGSVDSSAQIIKEFAAKDSRVIYIYQENAGVSAARNNGIKNSNGEYVTFVDADDWLHYNAIEILLKSIVDTKSTIAVSNIIQTSNVNENQERFENITPEKLDIQELFDKVNMTCLVSSCAKLYSKSLIISNKFNEKLAIAEDTIFFFNLLKEVEHVCFVNENLYYYYLRQGSATREGFNPNMIPTLDVYSDLCNDLLKSSSHIILARSLVLMYKYLLVLRTLGIGTETEKTILEICSKIGNSWIKMFLTSSNIDFATKVLITCFFYSRPIYELARLLQDPTMKDFYKNRRKNRKMNRKG